MREQEIVITAIDIEQGIVDTSTKGIFSGFGAIACHQRSKNIGTTGKDWISDYRRKSEQSGGWRNSRISILTTIIELKVRQQLP